MMIPNIRLLTFALLSLLLTGCGSEDLELSKQITDKNSFISVQVPAKWALPEDLNPKAAIQFARSPLSIYGIIIMERKLFINNMNFEEYSRATSKELAKSIGAGEVSEPEVIEIDGKHTLRRLVTGNIDGREVLYHHSAIRGEKYYYQVVIWTAAQKREQSEPVMQEIAASFEELPNYMHKVEAAK